MTCLPAQTLYISLKILLSCCLEAGSEVGRDFKSGQSAAFPDFSWAGAFVPFPLAQDEPVRMNAPR